MTRISKYFIALFLVLIFWSFLIPGSRVANDFHYSYPETLKSLFDFPFVWSIRWGGGLGHYVSSVWAWPNEIWYGFWGRIGVGFGIIERLFGVFLIVAVGLFSINKLLGYYKLGNLGKLTGMIFFLANSYLILLIDGGQLSLAIGYSLVPLAFYYYREYIDRSKLQSLFYFTLTILGISAVDLRVNVLLGFLIGINLLFDLSWQGKIELLKKNAVLMMSSGVVLVLFNSFWILPILLTKTFEFIPTSYSKVQQLNFLSFSTISNGVFFQQPHWYKNSFGELANINVSFVLIPVLIILAPLLIKKDQRVSFWLIVTVVFIFLSKGSQFPLPQANLWLYQHFPAFVLFRDPTKFFILIAISYSVLIGLSVEEIVQVLHNFLVKTKKVKFKIGNLEILLTPLIIGYFLYLNYPVTSLKLNGLFAQPVYEGEFVKLAQVIKLDDRFGRIVWIPTKSPLGFESPTHPAVDALGLLEKRPFAVGVKGTYETLNFFREATYSGQLLDVSGVESIVYPPLDPRKDNSPDQIKYYDTFLNQLKVMSYVSGMDSSSIIPKLDLKHHQDRFFLTPNLWWVIGSDKLYEQSTRSEQLNLSQNGLIFAEEFVGLGQRIRDLPFAKVLLENKSPLDFAATFLGPAEFIFPAQQLRADHDASGWWKRDSTDFINWREFLKQKYGLNYQDFDFNGGLAVAEGNLNLKINDKRIKRGEVLLARVLESSHSGSVAFYQDGGLIGSIDTSHKKDALAWFEVGKLNQDQNLLIQTSGEINVVNALAVSQEKKWAELKSESQDILNKQQVSSYEMERTDSPRLALSYSQINPTKFQIRVTGLKKPQLVVFSESYSSLWEMGDQKALPIYSLLNGFVIDKDGEYLVNLSAQKYVYPGLVVSLITAIALGLSLIYTVKRKR